MAKKLFKNKKVLIMGLGLHGGGVGAAKFFCNQGAEVSVTDLKTGEQLKESLEKLKKFKIKYSLGGHKESDFISTDLIVKNPDVPSTSPYLEIARKNNVPVETDINLFLKTAKIFVIGVTGTKGKSTTASLIYHLLKAKYKRIFLAGNIGVSPLNLLSKIKNGDKVVLELSSFELEDLNQSPDISVITNIMQDHLNRYVGMAEYIEAKKRIFKYQKTKGILILNKDDQAVSNLAKEAPGKVLFFSIKEKPQKIKLDSFQLFGNHNLSNLLAAIKVAEALKVPAKIIEKSLKTFKGVPSRQEFVKEINGVKYFNDTTATTPDAVIAAVNVFSEKFPKSRLIFISGGQNKGLEYKNLAKIIKQKISELVMLPGTASDKIKENLLDYKNLHEVYSMQSAVKKAKDLSKKGDIVVLSPGGASFNLFKNEFDRGDQFKKFVKELSK